MNSIASRISEGTAIGGILGGALVIITHSAKLWLGDAPITAADFVIIGTAGVLLNAGVYYVFGGGE